MSAGPQPAELRLTARGAEVVARRWGTGRRTIAFWHGLGALRSARAIEEAAPALCDRLEASVVAFDAPGFGRSEQPLAADGYRPSELAALAEAALDGLEVERALWLGHSWGATLGCHLAARARPPLSGLVLLDAGYRDEAAAAPPLEDLLETAREYWETQRAPSFEALEAAARAASPRWNAMLAAALRDTLAETPHGVEPVVTPEVLAAAAHGAALEPVHPTWPAIRRSGIPVLLLAAGEPAQDAGRERALADFRSALPQAVVEVVPGAGHDLLRDAGPALVDRIAAWVERRADAL